MSLPQVEFLIMRFNSFDTRSQSHYVPSHNNWSTGNSTFDPFETKPKHISNPSHINHGYGPSKDTMRILYQERSRFAFAQKPIRQTAGVQARRAPAAHLNRHSSLSQWPQPITTRATSTRIPRVVGPRPPRAQSGFSARRGPILATPKPLYHLPTWFTHFEDYEDEFIAKFCPSPESPSQPTLESPQMGFLGSESDYPGGEFMAWEKEGEGYKSFKSDAWPDRLDYIPLGSKLPPLGDWWSGATAFDSLPPYQGHKTLPSMEGYEDAGLNTILIMPRSP